ILNARDAMLPPGGILTIEAGQTADAVVIEVSDTGCGIGRNNLENIFEPFFTTKGKHSSSSQDLNAGLGLAFCKQIADAHGGLITVQSMPNKGTTFNINLPKRQPG
ncbi:MAG: sensor histidine kinase, partial [Planctomycetota bacterium]